MKKIFALLVTVAMLLSLVACSTPETKKNGETENNAQSETDNTTESKDSTVSNSNSIRPEFKEAMDAYEAFYDEYCETMKEYKENPGDLTTLGKYTEMLSKLEEMTTAFEAWDNDEISDEELKYYLDVNNRVTQKMIDVAG